MPVTAVNENSHLDWPENNVSRPPDIRQRAHSYPVPEPSCMESTTDRHLRLGVAGPDCLHVPSARGRRSPRARWPVPRLRIRHAPSISKGNDSLPARGMPSTTGCSRKISVPRLAGGDNGALCKLLRQAAFGPIQNMPGISATSRPDSARHHLKQTRHNGHFADRPTWRTEAGQNEARPD